jgi:hypothetical protein
MNELEVRVRTAGVTRAFAGVIEALPYISRLKRAKERYGVFMRRMNSLTSGCVAPEPLQAAPEPLQVAPEPLQVAPSAPELADFETVVEQAVCEEFDREFAAAETGCEVCDKRKTAECRGMCEKPEFAALFEVPESAFAPEFAADPDSEKYPGPDMPQEPADKQKIRNKKIKGNKAIREIKKARKELKKERQLERERERLLKRVHLLTKERSSIDDYVAARQEWAARGITIDTASDEEVNKIRGLSASIAVATGLTESEILLIVRCREWDLFTVVNTYLFNQIRNKRAYLAGIETFKKGFENLPFCKRKSILFPRLSRWRQPLRPRGRKRMTLFADKLFIPVRERISVSMDMLSKWRDRFGFKLCILEYYTKCVMAEYCLHTNRLSVSSGMLKCPSYLAHVLPLLFDGETL